jgi:hypothetical protein
VMTVCCDAAKMVLVILANALKNGKVENWKAWYKLQVTSYNNYLEFTAAATGRSAYHIHGRHMVLDLSRTTLVFTNCWGYR